MRIKQVLATILVCVLVLSLFVGCNKNQADKTPLVVACEQLETTYSPFFGDGDSDISRLVGLPLFSKDRSGAVVLKGIQGETTTFNGTEYTYFGPADCVITENKDQTVSYEITLRDKMKFSDGSRITADDLMFSMYVLCDPFYNGPFTFGKLPIVGLSEYKADTSTKFQAILKAGKDNTDFSLWTEAEQNVLWSEIETAGKSFVKELLAFSQKNKTASSYAEMAKSRHFDISGEVTDSAYFAALCQYYNGDLEKLSLYEKVHSSLFDFIPSYKNLQTPIIGKNSAKTITGIQKIGDLSVKVTLAEKDPTAIYQMDLHLAPFHYFDKDNSFDPEKESYGFSKGNLSSLKGEGITPPGAGPYTVQKVTDTDLTLQANKHYYQGAPTIKTICYKEMMPTSIISSLQDGTVSIASTSLSDSVLKEVKESNENKKLSGNKIQSGFYAIDGYIYCGLNPERICVEGNPYSVASKNLRRGLATLLSFYREKSIKDAFGDRVSLIEYPISKTSWASPDRADKSYRTAFSTSVTGKDIYSSKMKATEKENAAKTAALEFFEAAGYTCKDKKIVKAPKGAKTEYTLLLPAAGDKQYPLLSMAQNTAKACKEMGITLHINFEMTGSQIWECLSKGTADLWVSSWGVSEEPNLYDLYYADVKNNQANPGVFQYVHKIADSDLDKVLRDATSLDFDARKTAYGKALDMIVSYATEVPLYQENHAVFFSVTAVNKDSITPNMTLYYDWISDIVHLTTT